MYFILDIDFMKWFVNATFQVWFGIKSTNLNNEYIAWGPFRVITVIIFCSPRIFYQKIRLLIPAIIIQGILNPSPEISHVIICATTLIEETVFGFGLN